MNENGTGDTMDPKLTQRRSGFDLGAELTRIRSLQRTARSLEIKDLLGELYKRVQGWARANTPKDRLRLAMHLNGTRRALQDRGVDI
jgi:hypothetical protein